MYPKHGQKLSQCSNINMSFNIEINYSDYVTKINATITDNDRGHKSAIFVY
jgi:hypothetical protein